MGKVFDLLVDLGLTSERTRTVLSTRTRDVENLTVFADRLSGVIFIDDYYVGDQEYVSGEWQGRKPDVEPPTYERDLDATRRANALRPYYVGKSVVDLGCGDGEFLHRIRSTARHVTGVELRQDSVARLNHEGIPCVTTLDQIERNSADTVFSFHVLEHLPDPLATLAGIRQVLNEDGMAVFEVPHAGDFLMGPMDLSAFREKSLWSQHLILHTRESLKRLLASAGFSDVHIQGVQRYPLSNHLHWLRHGKPGGHKSTFASIDNPELQAAYQSALQRIDATDTLIAIARG